MGEVTLDFLGERVADLAVRVGRLENQVQAINHRLDRFEARIEASIATVDDHVAGVVAELRRINVRFDRLETAIGAR